jgi:hypothetical protein
MEMQVVKRTTEINTEHQPFLPYLLLSDLLLLLRITSLLRLVLHRAILVAAVVRSTE